VNTRDCGLFNGDNMNAWSALAVSVIALAMIIIAFIISVPSIVKDVYYPYTDGKEWYACNDHNARCYTDRFKY
jgi:hypothetical protein